MHGMPQQPQQPRAAASRARNPSHPRARASGREVVRLKRCAQLRPCNRCRRKGTKSGQPAARGRGRRGHSGMPSHHHVVPFRRLAVLCSVISFTTLRAIPAAWQNATRDHWPDRSLTPPKAVLSDARKSLWKDGCVSTSRAEIPVAQPPPLRALFARRAALALLICVPRSL